MFGGQAIQIHPRCDFIGFREHIKQEEGKMNVQKMSTDQHQRNEKYWPEVKKSLKLNLVGAAEDSLAPGTPRGDGGGGSSSTTEGWCEAAFPPVRHVGARRGLEPTAHCRARATGRAMPFP